MVLGNSMHLSRSKWMKYIDRKAYNGLQQGMKDWYTIGMKHTEKVMELVKDAEKTGKSLDENIGTIYASER